VISTQTNMIQTTISQGCKECSLTLSTEQMLAVFRSWVAFSPKNGKVAGDLK